MSTGGPGEALPGLAAGLPRGLAAVMHVAVNRAATIRAAGPVFERSYVGSTPLVALHAADGHVAAFVNEIPAYQPGQATIDLMRHRADLAHGAMDYLVVELLLRLKGEGYRSFNLGLAPFAGVGDRPGATLSELFEHLNRFFSYAGLRHYKAKFEPAWEDRFLVYQGAAPGLVKAALAVVRATEG